MKDVYPTEEELDKIEKWDLIEGDNGRHDKLYELIKYIKELWVYPDRFSIGKAHKDSWGKSIRTWYLSTGGWSGNEDIIGALHKNHLFWMMYWYQSKRGGHYWFKIPPITVNTHPKPQLEDAQEIEAIKQVLHPPTIKTRRYGQY